jgi:hypothetical protein
MRGLDSRLIAAACVVASTVNAIIAAAVTTALASKPIRGML